MREEGYPVDKDTSNSRVSIGFNAYSASGEVTAPLVYAHGGNPEDYDRLLEMGIDIKGKIALVRYSEPYSYRGFKALTAQRRGAAGLLIYSDPKEDGYGRGKVFPDGPWGPESHIQRGGIPFDFIVPGDPLTPGWASVPGARRLKPEESEILPKIMAVPLSYKDARPLLENLAGPAVPPEWQGGLPFAYHVGPGPAKVHLKVEMDNPVGSIWNVVGKIKGREEPEKWVVVGNHRDAWVYGAVDPSSGTAALLGLAQNLGQTGEGRIPAETDHRLLQLGCRGEHADRFDGMGGAICGQAEEGRRRVYQRRFRRERARFRGDRRAFAQRFSPADHPGSPGSRHRENGLMRPWKSSSADKDPTGEIAPHRHPGRKRQ